MLRKTPLKRTGFQQKKRDAAHQWARQRQTGKPRKLNVVGHSDTAEIKREIQAVAREIVIKRDGGCILRDKRWCNGVPGLAVLQADHLITRANSATYADTRLIVCVCQPCHAWKSLGGNRAKAQYDALVKTLLPPDRVALWERAEADSWRPHRNYVADWKLELTVLRVELARYQSNA